MQIQTCETKIKKNQKSKSKFRKILDKTENIHSGEKLKSKDGKNKYYMITDQAKKAPELIT